MAFLVYRERAVGAAPPTGPVVDAQDPRGRSLWQRQGMHQPRQRHPTGRPLQASAQPSTRSTTERQADLLQARAERHGAMRVARGQAGRLLDERPPWTAPLPTQEAANSKMDHHRPPDGFVHEAARVAAVGTPGAAPTARAPRRRRGATDLNVDDVVQLEHAVDAQPSKVREETDQTQTSTSWRCCASGRLRRTGVPEISRSASRVPCQSHFYLGATAPTAVPTPTPAPTLTSRQKDCLAVVSALQTMETPVQNAKMAQARDDYRQLRSIAADVRSRTYPSLMLPL